MKKSHESIGDGWGEVASCKKGASATEEILGPSICRGKFRRGGKSWSAYTRQWPGKFARKDEKEKTKKEELCGETSRDGEKERRLSKSYL